MNRIILIGNGFDLAHGMKTSYNDFLNNLWDKIIAEIKATPLKQKIKNKEIEMNKRAGIPDNFRTHDEIKKYLSRFGVSFIYKNNFLGVILNKKSLQNWVDIENEYYKLLKQYSREAPDSHRISKLNEDFNSIKKHLISYLIKEKIDFDSQFNNTELINIIGSKIYSNFKFSDFTESYIDLRAGIEYDKLVKGTTSHDNEILDNILSEDKKMLIKRLGTKNINELKRKTKELLDSEDVADYFDIVPEHILFLSFNYTFTESLYTSKISVARYGVQSKTSITANHIHGSIDENKKNPIIFGFGDEIDEDYKAIENLNDNRYLENIKSINYLETDNYKRLLEYLNSNNYQIFILGHSCGISDRTLLNTLFEHDNCVSIKPFYHKKKNNSDNYSDIVRNISRNFNDKVKMRDKVVNKKDCEPLS